MKKIRIGNKNIGSGESLYFIADIGANHDGNLDRAFRLIELAKEAGADAAKFQNFKANKIVSQIGFEDLEGQLSHQADWKKSVTEIYKDASVSQDWTAQLKEKCDEVGIDYFTSAYDFQSVDHVDKYVDFYKIGSGDITWHEILEHTAKKGKPILLATGASNMEETKMAMAVVQKYTEDIVLMQCNTNYTVDPDKYDYINLNVLNLFREEFPNALLGLSDHTFGHATVVGAVALGALVIEKHFTDDNNRIGPDHKFAMNPLTWREMVDRANEVYRALGDGIKRVEDNEKQSQIVQRRSLRATKVLKIGDILTKDDLEPLRPIPKDGLPPYEISNLIGKKLTLGLKEGEHITIKHI